MGFRDYRLAGSDQELFRLLTVLFVGLKLTGHIDWNWAWVTSPYWLPPIVFGTIQGIAEVIGKYGPQK